MSVKTTVTRHNSRQVNNKTFYSFKGSDNEWYNTGTNIPPIVGSQVEFELSVNAKGFKDAKNLVVLAGQAPVNAVAAGAVNAAKGLSKDDYWLNREARDVETQKRIELQSCRNSAIELVGLMITAGAIPLPKKEADKADAIAEAVKHYTDLYITENKSVSPAVEEVPFDAVVETPKVAVSSDWN